MTRAIDPDLNAHLAEEVTTLATCWRILRRDGIALAFTTHDRDLAIESLIYSSANSVSPSSMTETSGFQVDSLEVSGALTSDFLSAKDLREGRFDFARIDIFLVNWQAPEGQQILLRSGNLGEIEAGSDGFRAEVRGLKQKLQREVGEVYSPECRADLGDRRCRVALRNFTRVGAVVAATGEDRFTAAFSEADDWFRYGVLRWHSGPNTGLDFEIKSQVAGEVVLVSSAPAPISPGDKFEITAGCDKRFQTCRDKFDNVVNFRGEPFVPGSDSLFDYPGLA